MIVCPSCLGRPGDGLRTPGAFFCPCQALVVSSGSVSLYCGERAVRAYLACEGLWAWCPERAEWALVRFGADDLLRSMTDSLLARSVLDS